MERVGKIYRVHEIPADKAMMKPDYDKQVPNKRIQFVGDIDVNRFC